MGCFLRGRPGALSTSLAWRDLTVKATKEPPWQQTCSPEQDEVHVGHQSVLWRAQAWAVIQTSPTASLCSSDASGLWLEAATVTATFRALPFYHTALTEIHHDKMTVLLVPDKLPVKWVLSKKDPQTKLLFLSQLLVITGLLDSSAWRASLTYCEQGPGEYNYEREHHKVNNHKCFSLIPALPSRATKYLQLQKTPKAHCQAARRRPSRDRKTASSNIYVCRPTFAYNKTTLISWHRVGYFLHAPRCSNAPVPTATTSSSGDSQTSKAISFLGRQRIGISGFFCWPQCTLKTK